MNECKFVSNCAFFSDMTAHAVPEVICQGYRHKFCESDNSTCARFVVATTVGREKVPTDLGPHEESKAVQLLKANGVRSPYSLFS